MKIKHFKLYKPSKNFPRGIRQSMFKLARFVLIRSCQDKQEVFWLSKSSKARNTQEVTMEWIPNLPTKVKPVSKAYFRSIVE